MRKMIRFLAALFISILLVSCHDDGGETAAVQYPDVSGNYTVKSSTCAFAPEGGSLKILQDRMDKSLLSISFAAASDILQKPVIASGGPDVSISAPVPVGEKLAEAKVTNASVTVENALAADVSSGGISYHCSGGYESKDNAGITTLLCISDSAECGILSEKAD